MRDMPDPLAAQLDPSPHRKESRMNEAETRQLMAKALAEFGVPNPERAAASLFMELTTKAAVGDAQVLRWCEWPGCLRSYHVMTGPSPEIDGRGWIYVRNGDHILLCPDHANTGHRPQRVEWKSGWDYVNASCECGARGEGVKPANLDGNNQWWREHVAGSAA